MSLGFLGLMWLLASACRPAAPEARRPTQPDVPNRPAQPSPVALARATPVAPTKTLSPIAATVTPLPTWTPAPTATPQPVTLAYPPALAYAVELTLADLAAREGDYAWLSASDEAADIVLVPAVASAPTGAITETMALVVRFSDGRRGLPASEASSGAYPDCAGTPPETLPCWMPARAVRPPLKALRLDGKLPWESGYSGWRAWRFDGGPAEAIASLAAALAPRLAFSEPVLVVAVGDLMLDRSLGFRLGRGELDAPFAAVADVLRDGDITVGNLESALGTAGEPAPKRYAFLSPPEAAASMALAGFDLLTLANNHALDFGHDALREGLALLAAQGIAVIGAGLDERTAYAPAVLESKGVQLAFLGYVNVPVEIGGFDTRWWTAGPDVPGLAWGEPERVAHDVAAASEHADLVVVLLHSGYEYIDAPSDEQLAIANAAVAAGADLVIGHHAHVLQGVAFAPGGTILYGLGNFAFTIDGPPETAIARIWLDHEGVRQVELVPAIVQFGGAPRLATDAEAARILARVHFLSDQLAWYRR